MEEGIGHARRAVYLAPTNPIYYHTLAMLYIEVNKKEDAIKTLKTATKLLLEDSYYRKQPQYLKSSSDKKELPGRKEEAETAEKGTSPPTRKEEVTTDEKKASPPTRKGEALASQKGKPLQPVGTIKPPEPQQGGARLEGLKKRVVKGTGIRIKVLKGNGIKDAASEFMKMLKGFDYQVEEVGDAERSDWARTTVFYRKAKMKDALELAHKIPGNQDVFRLGGHEPFDIVIIVGLK